MPAIIFFMGAHHAKAQLLALLPQAVDLHAVEIVTVVIALDEAVIVADLNAKFWREPACGGDVAFLVFLPVPIVGEFLLAVGHAGFGAFELEGKCAAGRRAKQRRRDQFLDHCVPFDL